MSVRLRLGLLASLVSAVMIVAAYSALFLAVRGTLVGVLNDSLRNGVNFRVADEVRRAQNPNKPRPSPNANRTPRPALRGLATVATFEADGRPKFGEAPVRAPLREGFARVNGYRVLTKRAPTGVWVQAYRAEDELLNSLSQVTHVFWIVLPAVLLVGFVGGTLLAGRALRPVDAVTRLASRIAASGALTERVPPAKGRDEMARLTATINAMLDRLGGVIERERAFALAAAHELRTPLAVIRARASLALERERTPEQYRAALAEVRDVSMELTDLTMRLLALARTGGPARLDPVDLAAVALEAAELHGEAARARHVRLELDVNSAMLRGDATALTLAASNLVQNAVRHGRTNGVVWVRVEDDGDTARLRVEDDGPGIPAADVARLLEPFQRGPKLQGSEGAGLGLALASAVAEQHGGRLWLGPSAHGGLRAELALPNETAEAAVA